MRKKIIATTLLGLIALAVVTWHFLNNHQPESLKDHRPELRKLVEHQEQESEAAVASYTPKSKALLDDLTAPVDDLLRHLPGVVHVEVAVRADQPTRRIVHLLDRHSVPKDLYALDLKNATGRPLTNEEVDRLHEELLLEVAVLQLEQLALLLIERKRAAFFLLLILTRSGLFALVNIWIEWCEPSSSVRCQLQGRGRVVKKDHIFLMLRGLVDAILDRNGGNLGREMKAALPLLKSLDDRSTPNRHFIARKMNVDYLLPGLRVTVEDLFHNAKFVQ